jgi:hypothetical protein
LRYHLSEQPAQIPLLSQTQKEFLRWSVEKFHGYRAFARWLDGLPQEYAQAIQNIEFEDLYPSQTNDVQGQIEELVNISRRFGYQQVLVTVDTSPFPNPEQVQEIRQMLSWLEPMQHYGLKLIVALPEVFETKEIRELTRGRANVLEMETSLEHTWKVIARYLPIATEGTIKKIEKLCSPELIVKLQYLIQEEFDAPAVGAWLKFVETLLDVASEGKKLPLNADLFPQIRLSFYAHFMPLRLGSDSIELGVWRGYKWIRLDPSIYEFLAHLISHKGKRIYEIPRTSKGNLHTLASRLRGKIEPDSSQTIYLKNIKGEGYWLENFIP